MKKQNKELKLDNNVEIKAKIESILYCIPDGVTIHALANKLNLGMKADIVKILKGLQKDYEKKTNTFITFYNFRSRFDVCGYADPRSSRWICTVCK